MLSAERITWLIRQGTLKWAGRLRGDGLLLTLGSPLQPLAAPGTRVVDLADQTDIDGLYGEPVTDWRTYELKPGELLLGAVEEPLGLGAGLTGTIGGLSHLARVGLAVHVTSPFVLPGWNGHLTLELVNTGPAVLRLHHGMPLARLLVHALDGTPSDGGARSGGGAHVGHGHDGRGDTAAPHPFYGRAADLKSRYADEFPVGPNRR
ncbi:dCTP deaminase domain-containing protein [Streptomyces sp. NPDC093249]|uniref:dCTP deaminase n=1 Tax=unclassified Streptomyces TaxID=2593676 RepID=UPI00344CDF79